MVEHVGSEESVSGVLVLHVTCGVLLLLTVFKSSAHVSVHDPQDYDCH